MEHWGIEPHYSQFHLGFPEYEILCNPTFYFICKSSGQLTFLGINFELFGLLLLVRVKNALEINTRPQQKQYRGYSRGLYQLCLDISIETVYTQQLPVFGSKSGP